jgi:hypothetical protein
MKCQDEIHKNNRMQMDMIIRAFKSRDVVEYADTSPDAANNVPIQQEFVPLDNIDPSVLLKKIENDNKQH